MSAAARTSELVGLALAAGSGRRLLPLTAERAKVLCPVAGVSLLRQAVDRLGHVCDRVAVNVFADRDAVLSELDQIERAGGRATLRSIEAGEARGTAGAIGVLRPQIDGCGVLAINADSWSTIQLTAAVAAWDGERPLVAHTGARFEPGCGVVASITPWNIVSTLPDTPRGLFQEVWKPRMGSDALQTISVDGSGQFIDCGTAARYFAANLVAMRLGLGSIVDPSAQVAGSVERCVVWDGASVRADERLVDAIRTTNGLTIRFR